MNNKKYDMDILKHFQNQLQLYESRLLKTGFGPKSTTFNEISNENDSDEVLLRNTYLNGLEHKLNSRPTTSNDFKSDPNKKIIWADKNDNNRKDLLCNINPNKELYFIKEIKPITNHKKMVPLKSSFKKKSVSAHGNRSPIGDRNRDLQNLMNNTSKSNQPSNFVSVKANYSFTNQNNNLNNSNNLNEKDGFSYNKNTKLNNDSNVNNYINQNLNQNNYGLGNFKAY